MNHLSKLMHLRQKWTLENTEVTQRFKKYICITRATKKVTDRAPQSLHGYIPTIQGGRTGKIQTIKTVRH